jgi:arylsulfatase A-like enzyme
MEIMDTYLKLDKQIGRILDTLDQYLGKGNYLLFLTADHGVKPNNTYLEANRIHAGYTGSRNIRDQLMEYCKIHFGVSRIIEAVQDNQIYLNHALLDTLKLNINEVSSKLITCLRANFSTIGTILTKEELNKRSPSRSMNSFILNGYNIIRSGDLSFELTQNQITSDNNDEATTHQSSYDYDTHVPLIFFGWHIKPGESNREIFVEDIAPTISSLIHIQEPDATIGIPLINLGE